MLSSGFGSGCSIIEAHAEIIFQSRGPHCIEKKVFQNMNPNENQPTNYSPWFMAQIFDLPIISTPIFLLSIALLALRIIAVHQVRACEI